MGSGVWSGYYLFYSPHVYLFIICPVCPSSWRECLVRAQQRGREGGRAKLIYSCTFKSPKKYTNCSYLFIALLYVISRCILDADNLNQWQFKVFYLLSSAIKVFIADLNGGWHLGAIGMSCKQQYYILTFKGDKFVSKQMLAFSRCSDMLDLINLLLWIKSPVSVFIFRLLNLRWGLIIHDLE